MEGPRRVSVHKNDPQRLLRIGEDPTHNKDPRQLGKPTHNEDPRQVCKDPQKKKMKKSRGAMPYRMRAKARGTICWYVPHCELLQNVPPLRNFPPK